MADFRSEARADLYLSLRRPRADLASQHAHPEDAIRIHQDIQAKRSIGVHHSTWILSGKTFAGRKLKLLPNLLRFLADEHYLEPPKELARAREQVGLDEEEFKVVPPGRTLSWSR